MRPVFVGTNQIMNFYDSVNPDGVYAYSLWFGDKIMLQYPGNGDEEKARDFLENCLKLYEENQWDKTLWLKFHEPQKSIINRKTDVMISQPIGFLAEADETPIAGTSALMMRGNGMNIDMFRAIKTLEDLPTTIQTAMDEKMKLYEERIKALEAAKEPETDTWDKISGTLEKHPQLVQAAIGWLTGQTRNPQPAPLGINGAPETMIEQQQTNTPSAEERVVDNDVLDKALDRLNNVMVLDTDLTLLADYAEANPQMFTILLDNLRAQKK